MRRSFAGESLIRQLPLTVDQFFFNLLQLSCHLLALAGDVDLLLVNQANVEARGVADIRQCLNERFSESNLFNVRLTIVENRAAILLKQGAYLRVECHYLVWRLLLGKKIQLCPQVPYADNQII